MSDRKLSHQRKENIQQLPIPSRQGRDAIINSTYLGDIAAALDKWDCRRAIIVHSKALDSSTVVIKNLLVKLGPHVVGTKSGVGAHSPYEDILAITRLLHDNNADALVSVGSSSYSDACKIARLMQTYLAPENYTIDGMEGLVDQDKGNTLNLKNPEVKLIVVPTSLSASEWNHISSASNPKTHKKQHFQNENAMPDLILLDPEVAATSPRKLWLSSGMRAVDHCVETICNKLCTLEESQHMEETLAILLKGLKEYKEGENHRNRKELSNGISECQLGSRSAMMGLLRYKIPMGPSHAIGHQLGSRCGVMHGVTTCIMLSPVLRYMRNKDSQQVGLQQKVLAVFNGVLQWNEKNAADAVGRFVRMLELPDSLKLVGVQDEETLQEIAEMTMTDVWGGGTKQIETKGEVREILEFARG
jgi:alcohol dehydrogenase class IV